MKQRVIKRRHVTEAVRRHLALARARKEAKAIRLAQGRGLITIEQAMRKLRISRPTAHNWRKRGLPSVILCGKLFVRESALKNWVPAYLIGRYRRRA